MNNVFSYFFSNWVSHYFSINDKHKNVKSNHRIFFICKECHKCKHNSKHFNWELIHILIVVVSLSLWNLDTQKSSDFLKYHHFCLISVNSLIWQLIQFNCDQFDLLFVLKLIDLNCNWIRLHFILLNHKCLIWNFDLHSDWLLSWAFNRFFVQKNIQCLLLQFKINDVFLFTFNKLHSVILNNTLKIWSSKQILLCDFLNIIYKNSHSFPIHKFVIFIK